ncbi:MATE family efflux transporter [Candidatus Poribacteria bacterium]|nr:MATE family efflux transporter [Candidatus Poribacteria bacterium]
MADKIFVGHIAEKGTASLAAVGTASLITLFTLTILLTTLIGTIIIILRYIGAGEHEEASHYSAQSLLASLLVAIGIGMLWYLGAESIFELLHAPEDVSQLGVKYLRILGLFCPVIVINFMATGLLRFSGDTVKSMTANISMVILNLLGDYVLIFGRWGFPRMEVAGAAMAAGIANSVGLIISLSFLFSGNSTIKLSIRHFMDFRLYTFRRIMGKGIPVTTEQLVATGAYLVVVRYSLRVGEVAAAAHQAIINFGWLSTMFYLGVGTAATAMTGKKLGANKEEDADSTGRVAARVSICFGIIFGATLFIFSNRIMHLFLPPQGANNLEAIRIGAKCLKIVAVMQIPKAINIVLAASLRAAGDVRWLVIVNVVGTLVGELILARLLGITFGIGLIGIWIGMGIGETMRSAMNFNRYRKGGWKKIKI